MAENPPLTVLTRDEWVRRQSAHTDAADQLTAAHRLRQLRGERHPVWDFLFSYYPTKPSRLRRWSPGTGVALEVPAGITTDELPGPAKFHRRVRSGNRDLWTVDGDAFFDARGRTVTLIHRLLRATASRPARFTCFGMHEWAMVYHGRPRHPEPLRLGAAGTDRVVEGSTIACSHFDAFRFFTPDAVPLNALTPTYGTRELWEQPGCLHATMDLYKWAGKLGPLVPGELWLDTFRLACEVRTLDMEASPYDLRSWGLKPLPVETPAGRSEYARRQKASAARGQDLRRRLIALLEDTYPFLTRTTVRETVESGLR